MSEEQPKMSRRMMLSQLPVAMVLGGTAVSIVGTSVQANEAHGEIEYVDDLKQLMDKADADPLSSLVVARPKRRILHITMGDDTWEPTTDELTETAKVFSEAAKDPGALTADNIPVIATGHRVRVSIIEI